VKRIHSKRRFKMKKYICALTVAFIVILGIAFSESAQADITVTGPFIDDQTKGDWDTKYGDCFYLLPQTKELGQEPLNDANICVGGTFYDDGKITGTLKPDGEVKIWYFDPTDPNRMTDSGDQWNPCFGEYLGATFDNQVSPTYDPLEGVFTVTHTGSLRVAYYFLEEKIICRDLDFELSINNVVVKSGSVADVEGGKYVVFFIEGLEGDTSIKLSVSNNHSPAMGPACVGTGDIPGINVVLSGVFMGECEEEFEGCTPGYWRQEQHFDSWTGYGQDMLFSAAFECDSNITITGRLIPGTGGRPVTISNPTLLQAVWAIGGGESALARHAVAALLNAANPDVNYPSSEAAVISMVCAALTGGDIEGTKSILAGFNEGDDEDNCPLDRAELEELEQAPDTKQKKKKK
jgi:hypothetical protein